jgi:hypothetical protein
VTLNVLFFIYPYFKILCLEIVGFLVFEIKIFLPSSENLDLISFMTPCPIYILLSPTNHFVLLFSYNLAIVLIEKLIGEIPL